MRHCPACKTALPPGSGVSFDQKHNVLCAFCGGVVFPAELAKEPEKKVIPTTTYVHPQHPQYNSHSGHFTYPPNDYMGYEGGE